ncbi:GNAT family N-acetyltransferase [Desmospora activa]|uniref:Ribosomal-protein-serine acetyltransferase n=1 Tax=Desmospora activa DSM 45169 TaxID=1121389 RepID=A0A2T4ZDB2_9BACL|nr:GNAT family protein [Desmospora activa]PTM59870.1 ribosomal-protein-serine acetyltransferase [Desmospora activa DSM 45169]
MFEKRIDEELSLRLLEKHHANALFQLVDVNRERLQRWFPWVETTREPADSEKFIQGALQGFIDGTSLNCGIWYRKKLAGVVGPHSIREMNNNAEIGYWLGQEAEGNGVITRSCTAIIDYLVEERGINRIEARCVLANDRSRLVMERLGMQREGLLRQWLKHDHGYEDVYIYAVLAGEWRERRGRG